MTAPRRRVVQIAAVLNGTDDSALDTVYALCDDGSVWRLGVSYTHHPREWDRMPDIPQGKQK